MGRQTFRSARVQPGVRKCPDNAENLAEAESHKRTHNLIARKAARAHQQQDADGAVGEADELAYLRREERQFRRQREAAEASDAGLEQAPYDTAQEQQTESEQQ